MSNHMNIIVCTNVNGSIFKTVYLSLIYKIPRLVYLALLIPAIIPSRGWKSFNIWEQLKTDQNSIAGETKSRLRTGSACCHSVQNVLSSRLLCKHLKLKIYRTIILPIVLYGCATWSLTLREEWKLRVFENKVLRRIFGRRRDEVTGDWIRLHNEGQNEPHPISCG